MDEVIARLCAIQRKSEIWEHTEKPKKKFNYYNLILWGTAAVIVCLLFLSIWETESVKKERDKYEYYSQRKQGNFMKYRYLKLFGNQNTQKEIKTVDKLYQTKPDYYDSLIVAKEIEQGKH